MLGGYLGQRGHRVDRAPRDALRQPVDRHRCSTPSRPKARRACSCCRSIPQYSAPTTASVIDAVGAWSRRVRALPELRFVNHYHDDRRLHRRARAPRRPTTGRRTAAASASCSASTACPGARCCSGDPYHCECQKTARLLGRAPRAAPTDKLLVTFQSRFGKAEWLQPYTEPTLVGLARQGVESVDVMCPGFTSDCLETLEEIGHGGARRLSRAPAASTFHYIPCLNDQHEWIVALAEIAIAPPPGLGHLRGRRTGRALELQARPRGAHWEQPPEADGRACRLPRRRDRRRCDDRCATRQVAVGGAVLQDPQALERRDRQGPGQRQRPARRSRRARSGSATTSSCARTRSNGSSSSATRATCAARRRSRRRSTRRRRKASHGASARPPSAANRLEPAHGIEQGRPTKRDRRQLADWNRWSASVDPE